MTLGVNFFKMYPGGEPQVRKILENLNNSDDNHWCQLCGSGIPKLKVEWAYLVWNGKIQYRLDVERYGRNETGSFNDGGITRRYRNCNWVYMIGPVIQAPYDIPMKGFQGFRYTEIIF